MVTHNESTRRRWIREDKNLAHAKLNTFPLCRFQSWGVNCGRDHLFLSPLSLLINRSFLVHGYWFFPQRAVVLYNMGRWHFLKAAIIHVRRVLASRESIISRLSARASMPHEHFQRDLSITQIYDLSSFYSSHLTLSRLVAHLDLVRYLLHVPRVYARNNVH